ncbi:purine catabolism regulatory protein [Enterococcus sp. DIV2402]|uniref:Purine catabolism regulatory protein n=1 Tax=Candidatus Enterococcus lowellii TaxID=2230877 RepID=A0ABZ2SNZ5_9ENTE|nr:PucR family transcriptional regulator [Enterococcus sp. DIV2402]MBO0463731.1 PucR family transcriptional regulator ligand-binding domain-containing protein [Enterococcus sp. DIV2402]
MLTVEDLLHLDELKGVTLLAGEKNIKNQILQVNIMENPDAFDWLTPGEMLLTTGFIFKDDEAMQKRLIRDLAKMNCSALGFKLQRYFDEIPESMVKLANKVNLPILSIPYDYNFTEIISIINQNHKFNQGMVSSLEVSMHNKMYRILEAGNGSKHVIQKLSESIQNPVALLDQNFNPTFYSDLPNNPIRISNILKKPQNVQYIQQFLSERINSSLRFYQDPINLDFNFGQETVPIRIFPIKKNTIIISYLIIWNTMHELGPLDIIELKVAAQYLLLQLQLEDSLNIESYQKRNEMFFEIIRNKYQNEDDLMQFIKYYQLKTDAIYSIAILSTNTAAHSNRQMMNLSTRLNQMLIGYRQKMICIEYSNSFILLIQDPPADEKEYLKTMNTIGKSLLNQLAKESNVPDITMVIGPTVPNIKQIYVSFQQALQTLDIYNSDASLDSSNRIISYDDVFLKHIIRDHLSVDGLHKITERFITPLRQFDSLNKSEYLKTLQAYYQANRNITKAAENLFIHRNTLLHRLSKIEEILNISFDTPGDNLQLEFVIYIFPLL